MATDAYEELLREVARRGRFRSSESALTAALEKYIADHEPRVILDGPTTPARVAKACGGHTSTRDAEIAALRWYLDGLPT